MFDYIFWFANFPPQLATFLIATIPIAELRVALPVALGVYHLPVWSAYFWSVLGNILPVFFILWWLEPISKFLIKHSKTTEKFFNWLFARTRNKFTKQYLKYGEIALVIFVAVPLPGTGAWTGAVAAFLFGIPYFRAVGLNFLGVLLAGVIVLAVFEGVLGWNM